MFYFQMTKNLSPRDEKTEDSEFSFFDKRTRLQTFEAHDNVYLADIFDSSEGGIHARYNLVAKYGENPTLKISRRDLREIAFVLHQNIDGSEYFNKPDDLEAHARKNYFSTPFADLIIIPEVAYCMNYDTIVRIYDSFQSASKSPSKKPLRDSLITHRNYVGTNYNYVYAVSRLKDMMTQSLDVQDGSVVATIIDEDIF